MDSLFYLLTLGGVAWLVFWSLRDHERPARLWSPFDMRRPAPPVPPRPAGAGPGGTRPEQPAARYRRGR